jgi:hypothetical protein
MLVREPVGRIPFGRLMHRWEDNIKILRVSGLNCFVIDSSGALL